MVDDADVREYCRLCRTFSPPGDRCGNCHRRRDGERDALDDEVARSLSEARVVHQYSRVRSGALTFGPVGRVSLSLLPLLLLALTVAQAYRTRNGPWIALFGVAAIGNAVGVGAILLQIWKRDRID
jgi:hypothetical protein